MLFGSVFGKIMLDYFHDYVYVLVERNIFLRGSDNRNFYFTNFNWFFLWLIEIAKNNAEMSIMKLL